MGNQHPINETDPLHVVCMHEPGYARAYAELADAEAFYALYRHSKKSDPPKFYEARDRLADARRRFDFSTAVKQIQWTMASRLSNEYRLAEKAEQASPAGLARFAKWIVRKEQAYRHSLDMDQCLNGINGLTAPQLNSKTYPLAQGMARQVFTHRHSIYRAMLSALVRGGPAGLRDAWQEWGKQAIEEQARREDNWLCVDTSSTFIELPKAGSTKSGKNGYWEHEETHMVPLEPPTAPAPPTRMQAHRERQRLTSGSPKRGRGRPKRQDQVG